MHEAGDRYRSQFIASPIPTLIWVRKDHQFVAEEVNPAARELGNGVFGEAIGQPASRIHRDWPAIIEIMERAWTLQQPIVEHLHDLLPGADLNVVLRVEVAPIPPDRLVMHAIVVRDVSERVRQQEALERSEERYRGLFESSSELIYRVDVEGRILEVNPAVEQITGWTVEELVGHSFERLVHPDDLALARETFKANLAGEPTRGVFRILTRDGGQVYVDTVNHPELEDGKVVALFGTSRDITAARVAMQTLRDREQLLSTVLDRLPIAVVVIDETGRIVRSNPAGDAIWGFHRTHAAMAAPDTYHAWWADTGKPVRTEEWASTRALQSGETSLNEVIEIETAEGTHRTILNSAVPLIDDSGRISGTVVLNQDVTEVRSHERQREAMAARLRQVISSTSDGICTIDSDGRTTLVNPAAAEMLGASEQDLLGSILDNVVHSPTGGTHEHVFADVMLTRLPRPMYQDVFRKADGRTFDAAVSCAPILVDDEVHGAVITFRDVTVRNAIEREQERSQRLSAIGQLAATVAHEFNNVLMGITPFVEVIIRRAHSDDQLRSISGHIQQSLHRGKQITREILKFAQAPEPEIRSTRLSTLLHSSVPELQAIAGQKIDVQLAPVDEGLAACIDPTQIHQVLSNLVSNARDAMNGEGPITIEAALPAREEVPHLESDQWVRISVGDRGGGIDPGNLEKIFEPMFTTKQAGGTGLGLAIVQRVVKQHGGTVEVDTERGVGTTFRLYFRRCPPSDEDEALHSARERSQIRTLLLVEDDENVSAGLEAVLELEGITTHVVTRGADAEDAVARFAPDAVVLDRGLPDMDGLEVSRILLARWPELPLVFSTGHGGKEDIDEMPANARVAYLLKPYSVSTLLDVLDQVVSDARK